MKPIIENLTDLAEVLNDLGTDLDNIWVSGDRAIVWPAGWADGDDAVEISLAPDVRARLELVLAAHQLRRNKLLPAEQAGKIIATIFGGNKNA